MTRATLSAAGVAPLLDRLGAQVLVRGWLSANNIVFRGQEGQTASVVDTGYVTHAPQTVALVRAALGVAPLGAIVNTHLHSDHCGGNAALRQAWPKLRIAVPAGYRDRLCPWDESRLSYRETGQKCEPFVADEFLEPGTTITLGTHAWEIHSAPGHDPDAIMLFEPRENILISGDALWEDRLAIIFPELVGVPGFQSAQLSLDLIERLQPRLVIPGHGPPFVAVARAITESRQRLAVFSRSPQRHRLHAARALVTYHMLEHRQREYDELIQWVVQTPIFRKALNCELDGQHALVLAHQTVDRLLADGVLHAEGSYLTITVDTRAD